MDANIVISAILTLVAGIGIFLIACTMMSANLESISSNKLKSLFSKASASKMLGVGIGTIGTAAIQSSGATTVMVIGFVNAGIMSLAQAATIIYGANIGTTITAQIVALGMFGGSSALSTTVIFSACAGIGAFMTLFSKKDFWQKMGGILAGFGMLFVGLSLMSGSMKDFAQLDVVKEFLASINNGILLIVIGAVLTAIIQSSSVLTSIAIAMVVTGLINLDQGIYITMGSNIGSCIVAILAGITSGINAKRTALIHLIFNICGVVIFYLIITLFKFLSGGMTFGDMFEVVFPGIPQTQLAMFHTVFNVTTVLIILPLTNTLVRFVTRLLPEHREQLDPEAVHLYYIDDNMLKTPPVAVQQTKREVSNMARLSIENFNLSLDIICTMNFDNVEKFRQVEREINYLNRAIVDYVLKLTKLPQLSELDMNYLSTTFRAVRDIERVGDYAENIVEYAISLQNVSQSFSADALAEIAQLRNLINSLADKVMTSYDNSDCSLLIEIDEIEERVDDLTKQMEEGHIKRLNEGRCTADVGAQYLSLSSNAERVADHLVNVGKTVRAFAIDRA